MTARTISDVDGDPVEIEIEEYPPQKKEGKTMKSIVLKACPQCVDDKAMKAHRKEKTYECTSCGRVWKDERLEVGMRVTFVGVIRSTWHTDGDY